MGDALPIWLWNNERVLQELRVALLSVTSRYYVNNLPNNEVAYGERIFCYELYHQMRMQFRDSDHDLDISGEHVKAFRVVPQLDPFAEGNAIVPDLVMHQIDGLTRNVIAIEVKTDPELTFDNFAKDLKKLEYYVEDLQFRIGLMIVANRDLNMLLRSPALRQRVGDLIDGRDNIKIWNIASPVDRNESGRAIGLEPNCLNEI